MNTLESLGLKVRTISHDIGQPSIFSGVGRGAGHTWQLVGTLVRMPDGEVARFTRIDFDASSDMFEWSAVADQGQWVIPVADEDIAEAVLSMQKILEETS